MVNSREAVSEVEIILDPRFADHHAEALQMLREHGLAVSGADEADGVVEGTVAAWQFAQLAALPCVASLHSLLTYMPEDRASEPTRVLVRQPGASGEPQEMPRRMKP